MLKDMTNGSETRHIITFALPMFIGNIFQQLYNMVDSIVVGRYIGKNALAAVGTSSPIVFFLIAMVMGLSMGASVIISQLYGAGDSKNLKRAVSTAYIFLLAGGIIITLIGLLFSRSLLRLLQTPEEIFKDALAYLNIILGGLIFTFAYNAISAILRGLGDSKTPLYFLIITSLLNVVLDIWFVSSLGMGVEGAAWATVISQAVSVILCLIYIYTKVEILRILPKDIVFDKELFSKSVKLGIPSSIQQTVVSVSMMALQGLVNSYGSVTMAAYAAAARIDSIAMMPIMNLGLASTTFTAQNIGAGKLDRVKRGYKRSLIIVAVCCIITSIIILSFGPNLISIFIDVKETEVIRQGNDYITVVSFFYILMGIMFVTNGVIRGSGDMVASMISTMTSLGIRIISAYVLSSIDTIGYRGIWWSLPIGWFIGMTIAILRYRSGKWIEKRVVKKPVEEPA
ncbi:MAG TPA: MATE family efflux transporter [Clostridiaceae bacterium]|nr:MATE family efflux transporter [Clostridiaceae bacterium]